MTKIKDIIYIEKTINGYLKFDGFINKKYVWKVFIFYGINEAKRLFRKDCASNANFKFKKAF